VSEDIANLPNGIYSVTIIDQNNPVCYQDTSFEITQPQDPLSTATTLYTDVDCFGDSSGIAYAENAIGGTFPYTYAWDNGQNTQLAVNLWAGTHTITVTDANGCTFQSSIDIVNSNNPITGVANILNQVSCFGACDANVEFSSLGGILPHTYDWNGSQIYIGSGPYTVSSLCQGGGGFTIIDAIGCDVDIDFTITEPDELVANAIGNGAPIPGQLPTQPVQCFGFDDGTAYAFAAQGTLGYTFVWDSINGPTGQNIDSLAPGIHTVYVTDANGCTASDTVLITEPTKLVVEIDSSLTIYAYCLNTNSGELCAVASGGTPNYAYAWSDVLVQNTACAYNLQPDQYTITVMDERNCIAQASFDLDSVTNSFTSDSVIIIENSVSCFGLYDGALTATNLVGGVSPYTYNWNGPAFYTGTGSNISSLYFGSYNLAITDANGCPMTIGTYLNQPDQLEYDIYNTVDETCLGAENGEIWVHVNGGTSPYYYDDSQSNSFPIDPLDTVLINNDSVISNLSPGTYSIYITDDNNCEGAIVFGGGTAAFQAEINTLLTVPIPVVIVTNDTSSCYNIDDGAAEVDSTFLATYPLFTYTWEGNIPPGIPDGIDINNGADTSWGSFSPGIYWLVVHYADSASFGIPYSGCDNEISFVINAAEAEINVAFSFEDVSCYSYNDGEIDLTITGGWGPPYELTWDTTSALPGGSNSTLIEELTVGTYAVSISDANDCISISDYEVTEPAPLISDIIPTHVSCNELSDGAAIIDAVNGLGIITYLWSDGQSTQTATVLSAGTFTVIVTDNQGCSYTDSVVILEPDNPVTSVEVETNYNGIYDVSCYDYSDASASAAGSGVSFTWEDSNGDPVIVADPTGQNTGPILSAGVYTVTSTDANECPGYATITITEPDSLEFSLFVESNPRDNGSPYHISCFGADDGFIEIMVIGGVEGYDISWDNTSGLPPNGTISNFTMSDTVKADNLQANYSYTVTVIDANGCTKDTTTIVYTQPIEFIAQVTTINYAGPFHGPKNISFIDSTVSLEPYRFEWTWQDLPSSIDSNIISSNNLVVTHEFLEDELDTNYVFVMLTNEITGCQDSVEFIIEVQGMPDVYNVFTPNQDGINDEFSFSEYAMELVDVQIFNRWGQLVYTWVGSDKSWKGIGIDGKDLPEGVYFYVFEGKGVDGYHYDKKGSVTLLR
jgi:gliding motility-associated-like protein